MRQTKYYLGIDPGSHKCGWSIIRGKNKFYLVNGGLWKVDGELGYRLGMIRKYFNNLLDNYQNIHRIFIEDYFVRNTRGAKAVAFVQGILVEAAYNYRIPQDFINPASVKNTIAGKGTATKEEVREAVLSRYSRLDNRLEQDEYDAIAIALAGAELYGSTC